MQWNNSETVVNTPTGKQVNESMQLIDSDGNVVATFTKTAADGEVSAVLDTAVAVTEDTVAVKKATVTLTDAQIKAWPTTPVLVVPAQGAGTVIFPHSMTWDITSTGAYTNLSADRVVDIRLGTALVNRIEGSGDKSNIGNVLTSGDDEFWFKEPLVGDLSQAATGEFENLGCYVYLGNSSSGNLTGGAAGNELVITINYSVSSR